jgi:hypothetical protein
MVSGDDQAAAIQAYESFQERLDPIFDTPTLELLPDIIAKKRAQVVWAN